MDINFSGPHRRRTIAAPTGRVDLPGGLSVPPSEGDISQFNKVFGELQPSPMDEDIPVLRTSLDDKFTQRRSITLYRVRSNGESVDPNDARDLGDGQQQLRTREEGGSQNPANNADLTQTSHGLKSAASSVNSSNEAHQTSHRPSGPVRNQGTYRKSHGRAPGLRTLYGGDHPDILKQVETSDEAINTDLSQRAGHEFTNAEDCQTVQLPIESSLFQSRSHFDEAYSDSPGSPSDIDRASQKIEPPRIQKASIDKHAEYTADHSAHFSSKWRRRLLALPNRNDSPSPHGDSASMHSYPSGTLFDEKQSISVDPDSFYVKFDQAQQFKEEDSVAMKNDDYTRDFQGDADVPLSIINISKERSKSFARWKMLRFMVGLTTSLVALLTVALYLYLRYRYIMEVAGADLQKYRSAWILLALETILWISLGVSSVYDVLSQAPEQGAHISSLRIKNEAHLPVVDIFIITSGFSDSIVMDTVSAALEIDYPPSRYRVMVIDNSQSSNLQAQINHFRKRPMNLSYHRVSYDQSIKQRCHPSGYAVHFALQQPNPRNPSPFIAILDGDTIPDLGFLRALVPHLVQDATLGIVACPMSYYNLPRSLSGSTASVFEMTGALARPDNGTLQGIRSGIMIRRSALQHVGGFPAYSSIDDGVITSLLSQKGYRSMIVKEPAQCGTAPLDFVAAKSYATSLRIGPFNLAISRKSLWGKIFGMLRATCQVIFSFLICCCMISIPFQFISSAVLIPVIDTTHLASLIQMAFLMLFAFGLRDLTWCTRSSTPTFRRRLQTWALVSPYHIIAILSRLNPFRTSRYLKSPRLDLPASGLSRLRRTVFKGLAWLHFSLAVTIATSVGYRIGVIFRHKPVLSAYDTGIQALISGAFWPTLVFVDLWLGLLIPFSLALKSRSVRENLLIRDPFTDVARPKLSVRTHYPFVVVNTPFEFAMSVSFAAYSVFLLVFSLNKLK